MKGLIAIAALALLGGCAQLNLFQSSAPADNWTTWTCDSQAKVLWRYADAGQKDCGRAHGPRAPSSGFRR